MDKLKKAEDWLAWADKVVIGAGAGFSTAAGLRYDGAEFQAVFKDFIDRYHFTDLYTSSFYNFDSREEFWAAWALHIDLIRFRPHALPLYLRLLEKVRDKDYFVITTNVDGQFRKSGFSAQHLFEVQGDYAFLQCSHACHNTLYYNNDIVKEMVANTRDCRIPTSLVPRCPRCGEEMAVHVRVDNCFVQDEEWNKAAEHYLGFVEACGGKKALLLELGVGFNTPTIIRYPFEQLSLRNNNIRMIRINASDVRTAFPDNPRLLSITEDLSKVF